MVEEAMTKGESLVGRKERFPQKTEGFRGEGC